jgi:Mn-dependent DtxR family transcriptional regulator
LPGDESTVKEWIYRDGKGQIDLLTPKGNVLAEQIYERHILLTHWLVSLSVSPQTAQKDACRIEYDLSVERYAAIKNSMGEELSDWSQIEPNGADNA